MEDQQDESGLPDPTDVDWDAEFEQLPHAEIMADLVYMKSFIIWRNMMSSS